MELIIALTLFVALIGCWLILPGSTSTTRTAGEKASREAPVEVLGAVRQAV